MTDCLASPFRESQFFSFWAPGNGKDNLNSPKNAGIERRTVSNYFNLLEDMLIGVRLFPFTRRAKRRLSMHPKFYYFDTGVYRSIRPKGPLDLPDEQSGVGLETLVFQKLRAFAQEYPEARLLLFYGGREREYHDGIEVVLEEEALPGLPGILYTKIG